jgi:alpha-N-arabinofuranosidase
VVNEGGTAQRINVQIKGVSKIEPTAEAVVLAAGGLDDTNSLEQPQRIIPHAEKINNLSADCTRELPAYSITVLKLKTR